MKKSGQWFIKHVDETATGVTRWYAQQSLDEQIGALAKLGDDAAEHYVKDGVLYFRDVGKWSGSYLDWLGRYATAARKLGTPINDVFPRNIGATGRIFDPALAPVHQLMNAVALETFTMTGKVLTYDY